MNWIVVIPTILTFIGYYCIIKKQYLIYDIKPIHLLFWISASMQGLVDFVNIYYAHDSSQNEVYIGIISYVSVLITSFIVIYKILQSNFHHDNNEKIGTKNDKIGISIFTGFILLFLYCEYFMSFGDNVAYERLMAGVAIGMDIIALFYMRKEIVSNIKEQVLGPWVYWSIALLWFCILEAFLNYRGNFFPSIGWIMLCSNLFFTVGICYFIYSTRKKFLNNLYKRTLSHRGYVLFFTKNISNLFHSI